MLLALIIIVFAWLLNLILPWWSIAISGLLFGYLFNKKTGISFLWGFIALFLLWGGRALYIHLANDGILSTRIAEMLGVSSPVFVIIITAIIGGLISGLAAMTGALANKKESKS